MTDTEPEKMTDEPNAAPARPLPPAAQRALAEAEARRQAIDAATAMAPKEKGGRGGLEPGRYGDWEIKGLTSDF
ncbi:MAG: DUF1674 domain-containing protein [Devosia sp.]|nr:DUF1674 domain-containing protein [Devosia sp.]